MKLEDKQNVAGVRWVFEKVPRMPFLELGCEEGIVSD
jgi:hypothetical protein